MVTISEISSSRLSAKKVAVVKEVLMRQADVELRRQTLQ